MHCQVLKRFGTEDMSLVTVDDFPQCLEELWWVWDGSDSEHLYGTFNFCKVSATSEEINSQARNSGKAVVLGSEINYHNQQCALHI